MIHIFHGFLGSADDFSFLKSDEVVIHDLYSMKGPPQIHANDTLIGYSMGGRIALDLAHEINYQFKKIVLINAHPGLSNEEERFHRTEFETIVLQELNHKNKKDFLEWWNSLPIFTFDAPITTSDERYAQSSILFGDYRLSLQKNHLPEMIQNRDKVLFIVGLFDERYMELVNDILIPENLTVKGIPGGHRLFQQKEELMKVLSDEGII
jgi:2-succinyl-6-hydroxy-2,4-cyclohexadiene-1-carboxylate synthase